MRGHVLAFLCVSFAVMLTACANPSVFHAHYVESYSLRLAEVVYVGDRSEYEKNPELMSFLKDFGITDSEITDGSVVVGRTYCCGGPNEKKTAIWIYVPKPLKLEIGDIVEVWSGEPLIKGDKPKTMPNTAVRVRQKSTDQNKECKWFPENPDLWVRYLYCDWMEEEGWVQQEEKLWPCWIKRTEFRSPPGPYD